MKAFLARHLSKSFKMAKCLLPEETCIHLHGTLSKRKSSQVQYHFYQTSNKQTNENEIKPVMLHISLERLINQQRET